MSFSLRLTGSTLVTSLCSWISSKEKQEDVGDQVNSLDKISTLALGCLALGAVGDTLGFGSGHHPLPESGTLHTWELCGNTGYIREFIEEKYKGSYRNIEFRNSTTNEQNWVISDDTILHFMQAKVATQVFKKRDASTDQLIQEIAKQLVCTLNRELDEDKRNERCFGLSTRKTYALFKDYPKNWMEYIRYNPEATGCGGSMRGMIFGFLYPGKANRDQLISAAINAGFLTNPSLTGVLGTLSTASFVAFALEDLPLEKWIPELLEVFKRTRTNLEKIAQSNNYPKNYKELIANCLSDDWQHIHACWDFFFSAALKEAGIPSREKFPQTLAERDKLHVQIEEFANQKKSSPRLTIGDRAETAVMLAYHGFLSGIRKLLDHFPNIPLSEATPSQLRELHHRLSEEEQKAIVDEIVQFTVVHGGDNDSTGNIALSLYGTIFGIQGVEKKHVFQTEIMPEVVQVAKKIGAIAKQALAKN
jgi:ADP-ribosylarginine hydrolase